MMTTNFNRLLRIYHHLAIITLYWTTNNLWVNFDTLHKNCVGICSLTYVVTEWKPA